MATVIIIPLADIQRILLVWLYQMFLASLHSEWLVPVKYLNSSSMRVGIYHYHYFRSEEIGFHRH